MDCSNNQPKQYTLTDLAGYKVYHGFASRSYDVTIDVGLTTSAVLSGLQDGRAYYFAVTAYDTSGNQSLFTEVQHTTALADTDGDGLTDAEEVNVYRTDPGKADTDGDGMDDRAPENVFWAPTGTSMRMAMVPSTCSMPTAITMACPDGTERTREPIRPIHPPLAGRGEACWRR